MRLPRIFSVKQAREAETPGVTASIYLSARALRQLNRLQLNASRFLPGHHVGQRSSLRRKPAPDFREHRLYTPGDDVRFVDWKASARQEHIFIKQGEHPKEATVYILLDCSASMAWGEPPRSDCALSLAAALSYLALSQGDRLVIAPLTGSPPQNAASAPKGGPPSIPSPAKPGLGPLNGKGQVPGVVNYLRSLTFRGQADLTQTLRSFSRQRSGSGGLVLLLSDLLGVKDLDRALESLPAPTWDVVVLHLLHPDELKPARRGDWEMVDVETEVKANYDITAKALQAYHERLEAWRSRLELACVENNAFYTLIPTNWSLDQEIIPHLRGVDIVRAV